MTQRPPAMRQEAVHVAGPHHAAATALNAAPAVQRLATLAASLNAAPAVQRLSTLAASLNAAPAVQRLVAMAPSGSVPATPLLDMAHAPGQTVQRVIAGLEDYQDPAAIPPAWVGAYREDLLHNETHLTDEDILFLYQQVRGCAPDEEGVTFNNVNGEHWDAAIGGQDYRLGADGSCAVHGIDLAHRLLGNGEAIDREKDHFAPPDRVAELRRMVQARQATEEAIPGIRQEIAHRIAGSELVVTTGFGPKLRNLLEEAVILKTATGRRDFFEITYTNMPWKIWGLPKPSVGIKELHTRGFFTADFESSGKMMEAGLARLHELYNSGVGMTFNTAPYTGFIRRGTRAALPAFRSAKEASIALGTLKTEKSKPRGEKRRLQEDRLLPRSKATALKSKLKNRTFRRKVIRASRQGAQKFKQLDELIESPRAVAEIVAKGGRNLSAVSLRSAQKYAALSAFKAAKDSSKKDLQFPLRSGGSKSSFGKGGFQVKGLGAYPAEIVWFASKFASWNCSWRDLMSAMQEHNYEELLRLTGNNVDAERLLRFEDLQLLERWRADYFAVGVAAHARLGYHGQQTMPGYLREMPMREEDATTNVANTMDIDSPRDKALWGRQEASTIDGIDRLLDIEIGQGEVYDQGTVDYLDMLAEEPEDGEPSMALINASAQFMMSPNPYQNDDPLEAIISGEEVDDKSVDHEEI